MSRGEVDENSKSDAQVADERVCYLRGAVLERPIMLKKTTTTTTRIVS